MPMGDEAIAQQHKLLRALGQPAMWRSGGRHCPHGSLLHKPVSFGYTSNMAKILGKLLAKKQRAFVRSMTALVSEVARLQAEMEEGYGPHVLAERLRELDLPDSVTIVLRPTLAFLTADACIIGPGKVLVISALHWSGEIGQDGKKGEWTGAKGGVDLGRPDRRAHLFCDRLAFSGLAKGFELEPVVVFTGGPVKYLGGEQPQATLVQWTELEAFLKQRLPAGIAGFSASDLIKVITPS
jgi:hypothetical protein